MPRIFITGNGSGIGKAVEQECLARGWEVDGTHKNGERSVDVGNLSYIQAVFSGWYQGLVNCAGTLDYAEGGAYRELDPFEVFHLNVVVPAQLTELFVTHRKTRSVVNIGSMWGETGGYGKRWAYAASKAALHNLTRTQARMYPQARINCVAPGIIDTPIHSDLAKHGDGHSIQGRIGTASEVAKVVAFLLSDEASYMTGAIVPVCGGR